MSIRLTPICEVLKIIELLLYHYLIIVIESQFLEMLCMKKRLADIQQILDEIKKKLEEFYGERLKSLILYGSYARGEATDDSDIDLIILLKDMRDTCEEILRFSQCLGDLELIYDTLISILPFDVIDYEDRHLPVILNAKKEGIIVYESG